MLHLLMHASIFLPTANGCYLQVTGTPITQVRFHHQEDFLVHLFHLTFKKPGILQVAAKHKKSGLSAMKPLASCTTPGTKPECKQAAQPPDSPVTQASSITSTMQPYSSSPMADFAPASVCRQDDTVYPMGHLGANSSQHQTASKYIRALPRHHEGCTRRQLSSSADVSASSPVQDTVHHEREAGTACAGAAVRRQSRSSSWQRQKAAKLRQAQQDWQSGKFTCVVHIGHVHGSQQTVMSCHVPVSSACQAKPCAQQVTYAVCCHCSGQGKDTCAEEEGQQQPFRQQSQPATLPSVADKLSSLHVQDDMLHGLPSLPTEEHMADAGQHDLSAANPASQQQLQDTDLLHCVPVTQLLGQEKEHMLSGNAQASGGQHGQDQALQLSQDMQSLHTANHPEDATAFSGSLSDCAMADATLPVSQMLPDSVPMDLGDLGGVEQPEVAARLSTDREVTEALQELEDFCRSEL